MQKYTQCLKTDEIVNNKALWKWLVQKYWYMEIFIFQYQPEIRRITVNVERINKKYYQNGTFTAF